MQNGEVQFFAYLTGALQIAVFNCMIAATPKAPLPGSDPFHDLTGGQLLEVVTVIQEVLLVLTVRAIWLILGYGLCTGSL